ncbi:MAG: hypothetical protein LAO30_25910, partial [Acidobacteriia bacterium]|nr:hypothetical protein [Terriglobia bacterium]
MKVFLGLAVLAFAARADTILLINHSSWNGVVTYADGTFTVKAAEGPPLILPAKYVELVEFNSSNSNPNPPPDVPSPRDTPKPVRCQAVGKDHRTANGTL